jgi:hypothetical protein
MVNVRRIRRINRHPIKSEEDSAPECISDTEDWLNWNGDLDNTNDSDKDCAANVASDMVQEKSIEDPESPDQRDVSTAPNLLELIHPTGKSKRQAEMVLVMVNAK